MKKDEVVDLWEMTRSFQRGEEKGFLYFFNELQKALVWYARRIVVDLPTAEDIVEETFIKIWERHSTFKHPKVIKSWLYVTVKNACINALQERKRKLTKNAQYIREFAETEYEPNVNLVIEAETLRIINEKLDTLPVECRKVFKSLYIEGKTVRETAMNLNLSISTIKNQKGRGLGLLKKRGVGEELLALTF